MFKKDLFLNICGNNVANIKSEKMYNNIFKDNNIEELKVRVKHKKVYVLIEGEEIHIKLLVLPRVSLSSLENMIENELLYLYGNRAEDIYYDYNILKSGDKNVEVAVFCINSEVLSKLNKYKTFKKTLKKVNTIQMYFVNYLKKCIKDKNYILIFKYYNNLYFVSVLNNEIIANRIIESPKVEYVDLVMGIDSIVHKISLLNVALDKIYICNIHNDEFKNYLCREKKFQCTYLKDIKEKTIIQNFIKNRG